MYEFNGSSQYISLPSTVSHLSGNHTICFWIIPSVVTRGANEVTLTTDWNASYRNYLYRIYGSKLEALSGDGSSSQASTLVSATTLVVGTRYHVAFVRDEATLRIYIGGVQDASGSIGSYRGGNTSLSRNIGVDSLNSVAYSYGGKMEDFRMYSRALSAAEIQTIYRACGKDNNVYGLELREPMDFLLTGKTVCDIGPKKTQSN